MVKHGRRRVCAAALLAALCSCGGIPAAAERARQDASIGVFESKALRFAAQEGLLHVRSATDEELVLRATSAEFAFELSRTDASLEELTVRIWNLPAGLTLSAPEGVLTDLAGAQDPELHLGRRWTVRFPPGVDHVAVESNGLPPGDFTFLAFGDIQSGIDRFDDVIEAVNAESDVDFILMLGDLTQSSTGPQFDRVEEAYARIRVPIYATPGNHDVQQEGGEYQGRFGRASYSLTHRGARFTSFDSASAVMSSDVFERFTRWTEDGRGGLHVVFSHIPALEVLGLRSGQWNSRREAHRFLSRSAATGVDLLLFGHIHSYDRYELGGIQTFISGGCGAREELLDGIGRHYLRVKVHAETQSLSVEVVRVDP